MDSNSVIGLAALGGMILGALGLLGWIFTTWYRVKHGYPLDGQGGQAIYPRSSDEAMERLKLLTGENARFRAEVGALKDRLATIERIVTDGSYRLDQEIETLRRPAN